MGGSGRTRNRAIHEDGIAVRALIIENVNIYVNVYVNVDITGEDGRWLRRLRNDSKTSRNSAGLQVATSHNCWTRLPRRYRGGAQGDLIRSATGCVGSSN